MVTVQRNAGGILELKTIFYKNGSVNLPILPGYALCYDPAEDLVPQAGEFGELARGNVAIRPAAGVTLEFFVGIVMRVRPRVGTSTDYSGFVEVAEPRSGSLVKALCHANATAATTVLQPEDALFSLKADASATADLYSRRSCAIYGDATADTSSTAAMKWVWLLGK